MSRPNNADFEALRNKRVASIMESKPYTEREVMTSATLGHMIGLEPDEMRSVIQHMVMRGQLIKTLRGMKAYYTPPAPNILSRDWRKDKSIHEKVEALQRGW